jgi:hypothetical protein
MRLVARALAEQGHRVTMTAGDTIQTGQGAFGILLAASPDSRP